MKRTLVFVLTIIIMVAMLTACSTEEPAPEPTPVPTTEPTPEPTPVPTVLVEVLPTPMPETKLSYTTGMPFDGDYQPVMVVIENSPAARPQTGLQTADIVYEVPVEGSITRFVCIFSDNVPSEAMPIRSARIPFMQLQREWNTILMHFGGAGYGEEGEPHSVYGSAFKDVKIRLDGWRGGCDDYFYRVSDKKAPHNVMGNPSLAQKLYDYEPEPLGWRFDNDTIYTGEEVSEILLKMCSSDKDFVSYTYNRENDVYLRSMNGKPFLSNETGKQVSVANVIVQYCNYSIYQKKFKIWKLVDRGNADIHIGGKCIKGSWERISDDDKTIFYDSIGNQILLNPGNTWIHIHPEL